MKRIYKPIIPNATVLIASGIGNDDINEYTLYFITNFLTPLISISGTAEEAVQQINDKGYALPFAKDPRTLYKIGINFGPETRNIDRWMVE